MAKKKPSKPILLMFHQGGFIGGADDMMDQQQQLARQAGFKPVRVNYTLGNLGQAVKDAKAAAKAYNPKRKVLSYGESAGGGLSALLADRGLTDAGFSYSGVNDLPAWYQGREQDLAAVQANPELLNRFNPSRKQSKSKIRTYTTAVDRFVNPQSTLDWAARDPNVSTQQVSGEHIPHEQADMANVQSAMDWLIKQALHNRIQKKPSKKRAFQ